jgi:hypothetical protein
MDKILLVLITLFSIFVHENVIAGDTLFSKYTILGNWKLISIYYGDSYRTRIIDEILKNGITFTKNEVSEIIQISPGNKPYKMTHSYTIEGNCIMLILPSEKTCWEVKKMTEKNLILITPIGEYNLIKYTV